jgi:hypothetical protein
MQEDRWINGCVLVRILDKAGKVKRRPPPGYSPLLWMAWQTPPGRGLKKLLVCLGSTPWPELPMEQRYYHLITWEWSYLLGDVLGNTGQYIQLGTGGQEIGTPAYGTRLRCKTPVGIRHLDEGYPAWDWDQDWNRETEVENDTIIYAATFPAGTVKTKSVNEVCICDGNDPESACLAYGRFIPGVSLRRGDTLQIRLELSCTVPVAMAGEGS